MRNVPAGFLAAVFIALVAPVAWADGPTLEPGNWRTTTTVSVPMMPEPRTFTAEKCITEDMNTDPLAEMVEQGGCTVKNRDVSGNTLRFEVECTDPAGGKSKGKGEITTEGGKAYGSMKFSVSVQGQEMNMSQSWNAERLGDCQ